MGEQGGYRQKWVYPQEAACKRRQFPHCNKEQPVFALHTRRDVSQRWARRERLKIKDVPARYSLRSSSDAEDNLVLNVKDKSSTSRQERSPKQQPNAGTALSSPTTQTVGTGTLLCPYGPRQAQTAWRACISSPL